MVIGTCQGSSGNQGGFVIILRKGKIEIPNIQAPPEASGRTER